jgi:DNA transformation protein
MATQPETMEFILEKLGDAKTFTSRMMFGEYALYANGKPVGFVCDDLLYVKILPESAALEDECEKGHAYPGSKLYYIVEESQLSSLEDLPQLLIDMAKSIPAKKKKAKKTAHTRSTK